MQPVQLIADLHIKNEYLEIDILSNEKEIAIAIIGESIPKIKLPLKQVFGIIKNNPFSTDQVVSVVYNQKEIYHSGKSLVSKYNYFFLLRTLFKNLF
ncbi:hypothetical protein [Cecembia sp.]|uniref:hypothetical protein n=1 Tax=Cecembia sp. TaxID=1898110 RepID=UPI0025BCC18B|nr:hypothetical protein [Cecembia sp.]